MTKEEFCNQLGIKQTQLSNSDYDIIEFVYSFHPVISETEGKKQIADLFSLGGMALICDMYPRALVQKKLEDTMLSLKNSENELAQLMNGNKKGTTSEYDIRNQFAERVINPLKKYL